MKRMLTVKKRTGGDDGGGGDNGAGEAAAVLVADGAAYRSGRSVVVCRRPAGIRGSLPRGPSLRTCGSCPPSGSRCL